MAMIACIIGIIILEWLKPDQPDIKDIRFSDCYYDASNEHHYRIVSWGRETLTKIIYSDDQCEDDIGYYQDGIYIPLKEQ